MIPKINPKKRATQAQACSSPVGLKKAMKKKAMPEREGQTYHISTRAHSYGPLEQQPHKQEKQDLEIEEEESKVMSQMSEEDELKLPDLPKEILEKFKKYEGAIILNKEKPLSIQFPSEKFLYLLGECLEDDPLVTFIPNQALSVHCRAELLNTCHSFHEHPRKIASHRLIPIQNRVNINNLPYGFQESFKLVVNILKMLTRMHDGYQMASVGALAAGTVLAEVLIKFGNVNTSFKVAK